MTMILSKMVTVELEVEVEYEEDSFGDKTPRGIHCQTMAPVPVRDWAARMAWVKVAGGKA
jgi:hypothetical protein